MRIKTTQNKIKKILLDNFGSKFDDLKPEYRERLFLLVAGEIINVSLKDFMKIQKSIK